MPSTQHCDKGADPALFRPAEIDALRGLVIVMVLFSSYVCRYQTEFGHSRDCSLVPSPGFLALQLFLALSAYRLTIDLGQLAGPGDFVRARLLRYLPALWPAVILAMVASRFGGLRALQIPLDALPANLLMSADLVGVPVADPSFWRLKIELLLSLAMGLVWYGSGRRIPPWIVLAALALDALGAAGTEPVRQHTVAASGLLTLDGYLPPCAFGLAICHLVASPRQAPWWVVAVVAAALVPAMNDPVHSAWVMAALAAFALAASGLLPSLARLTTLRFLGELSFPIYVIHLVPGFAALHAMEAAGMPAVVAIAITSSLAVACGYALHRAVEVPVRALAETLLGQRQPVRQKALAGLFGDQPA